MKNLLSAQPKGLAAAEEAVGELRPGAAQLSRATKEARAAPGLAHGPCPQHLGRDAPWGGLLALGVSTGALQVVFTRGGRARCTPVCSSALATHTAHPPISYCHSKGWGWRGCVPETNMLQPQA